MSRYATKPYAEGSTDSAIKYSVVDRTQPKNVGKWSIGYEAICICEEQEAADLITQALNENESLRKQVADLQEALDNLAPYGKAEDDD